MKTVMIIPAKGYSSRLPGKNKRAFAGHHSLVAWSIVQGVMAKHVDEVWVSTDTDEIARIAEFYGAKVMMRNYVDEVHTIGTVPVYEWVRRMVANGDLALDDMVITRLCTTPTLLPWDIDNAITMWRDLNKRYGAQGIAMKAEIRTFCPSRKVVDNISRDLPEDCFCENSGEILFGFACFGLGYVEPLWGGATNNQEFLEKRARESYHKGDHPRDFYYKVHHWQMQDVDTQEEWDLAEVIAEHYILKGRDMLDVYKEYKK